MHNKIFSFAKENCDLQSNRDYSWKVALFVFISTFVSYTAAAEKDAAIFSYKGFGTLATTGTDTDAIGFRRDISTSRGATKSWDLTTDSRLGIQLDAKFSDQFDATLQWTARDRTGNFFEQNLDLAFLRWRIQPDLDVRFGRVSTDVFMLSDHRNVGYAYPWIRPPHEFYASVPLYHYDGVDITKKFEIDGGYLSVKTFGGYSLSELIVSDEKNSFSQESIVFSSSLTYEKGDWRTRLGYAHLDLISEPKALSDKRAVIANPIVGLVWPDIKQLLPYFNLIGSTIHYGDIGVAYDDGEWLAQAEASYAGSNTPFFPDAASGYLNLGRRFSSFTFYTLLGISKSIDTKINIPRPLISVPQTVAAQKRFDGALNHNGIDEKSVSLGLRWDFHTNMAFKAQWSHYWLGNNGAQNWVKDTNQVAPDNVNVFSVGIDFLY